MWSLRNQGRRSRALAQRVERLLDERCAALPACVPGVVFLVRLADGREVLRCVAGGGAAPSVDEHTLFQVMSISKPVTALGTLRLAEMGVLDIDAPVGDLLRTWRFPDDRTGGFDVHGVSVRRILCHAAGLNIHGYDWSAEGRPRPSAAELLDGLGDPNNQLRVIAPPGERALYSGGGYTLLQQVVEDVTGRAFEEVMQEVVLEPLGMERSTFRCEGSWLEHVAGRHDAEGRALPPARIAAVACSGLYASARDLTRLLVSVLGGGPPLVSAESLQQMTMTQAIDAQGRGWAAGFYMLSFERGEIIHHGGFKRGWWSQIDGVIGRGHSIVTLTNGDASDAHVKPIVAELRGLLLGG